MIELAANHRLAVGALLLSLCSGLFAVPVVAAVGDVPDAEQVVNKIVEEVLPLLRAERQRVAVDHEYAGELLRDHVVPVFDLATVSRWVLGKHWRKASQEQRAEFKDLFVDMLVRTFSGQLAQYVDSEVTVTGSSLAKRNGFAVVGVTIEGGKLADGISVKYRFRKQKDDSWLIVDVVVEGVSVLVNFRNVMGEIISREGYEALLSKMREGQISDVARKEE